MGEFIFEAMECFIISIGGVLIFITFPFWFPVWTFFKIREKVRGY